MLLFKKKIKLNRLWNDGNVEASSFFFAIEL